MQKPEILAPVGDWDMLRAAVHNGADAVYIGMPGFNARGRAPTLTVPELDAMIRYAHLYGVKVFLAFNILIFERELLDVAALLREVLPLGPDALIVQDLGLARLVREICPTQIIHASTQMTVTDANAIDLTADLDIRRYVLGREVSIKEMEDIRSRTSKELEVFVHGALCVSYSGQCLTSESMGGRSANRGQCAQSCRLGYELVADGRTVELGNRRHLVSPQDLCGLDDVERLAAAGIESFKIEGRLKSPEYVATTVKAYREKVDGADSQISRYAMEKVYSRGFFNGWLNGVDHQRLVDARYSSHHGAAAGTVLAVTDGSVTVRSPFDIRRGDGVLFADFDRRIEIGATVYDVEPERTGGSLVLSFAHDFDLGQITHGMSLFVNSSPHDDSSYRRSFNDKELFRRVPLAISISGAIDKPLTVRAADPEGRVAECASTGILQPARTAPLTEDSAIAELGALGATVYTIGRVSFDVADRCFLHSKELKEIRRSLCEQMDAARTTPRRIEIREPRSLSAPTESIATSSQAARLNLLIRSSEQLAAIGNRSTASCADVAGAIDTIYLDFEFGKEYAPTAKIVREMGYKVGIATTRIMKPGESAHLKVIERIGPDAVLVRNLGALSYLQKSGLPLIGDFSLNVANTLTASYLFEKGLTRLCPSYDLNREQLLDIISKENGSRFEVTIHQYIPAFHMEHCVFAAFLSKGSSYRDCGRPCERHRVELRDRNGALHPLKADAECRNTMFNGIPQSAARLIPELKDRGVSAFRIEALFETPEELRSKISSYSGLISGIDAPEKTISNLGIVERYGVTDQQLYSIHSHADRKKTFTELSRLNQSADPGLVVAARVAR